MNQYIGQLLDNRYEILEVIGTGGMAVVYKARCHRLNRFVAVKVLKDEYFGDEEFRRRFRAEGEAVAMLSHPNIVQVFDVSSADNAYFIVMELIDGISLKQYMEVKGVLNWKETLHFATQIAKGLEHAHSRGIVHRDIKPHNVMVLKNGSVKVMDFGIAQVMNKNSTLTKEALGSVHYISPEQAKGSYTDNRSDIYSLGVVMYEMMTGRPPYDGDSPVSVAIQHINGGAVLPSTLNPNIPAPMEQIIMKAMALDPRDRYSSATELLQDLEEFRKNPGITFQYRTILDSATRTIGPIPGSLNARQSGTGRQRMNLPPNDPAKQRDAEALRRARERRAEEARREEERHHASAIAVVTCSLVAVIALVVLLVSIFNGVGLSWGGSNLVEVPYLVSSMYSEDLQARYPDLEIREPIRQYDSFYKNNEIMDQKPESGTMVAKGTELYLTVSMGQEPNEKVMENLVGDPMGQADSFLRGQGFQPFIRQEPSDTIPEGHVTRTEPEAGAVLTENQTIRLWVSTGPEIETAKMPNVLDSTEEYATQLLDSIGFRNVSVIRVNSNKAKGNVVSQSHTANSIIDVTTHITLEVSDGLTIKMIKVLEMDEENARSILNQLGFTNVTSFPVESDHPAGRIVSQSIAADSIIDRDQEISLGVSTGSQGMAENPAVTIIPVETEPVVEPETLTKGVTFDVPVREQSYDLLICRKDHPEQQIAVGQVQPGDSTFTVVLGDSGIQEYDLYINGEYWKTQKVTF